MDTGLNNTNKLHLVFGKHELKDVEWLIEATSEEQFQIWKDYHETLDWEEISIGYTFPILELDVVPVSIKNKNEKKAENEVLPINIEFHFALVNGHKIAFYGSPARLVHHGYIDAFLITYFQRTHNNYTRWNHTDAGNAHNCLNYLKNIDTEPRNTRYKPDEYEKKYHIFKKIK